MSVFAQEMRKGAPIQTPVLNRYSPGCLRSEYGEKGGSNTNFNWFGPGAFEDLSVKMVSEEIPQKIPFQHTAEPSRYFFIKGILENIETLVVSQGLFFSWKLTSPVLFIFRTIGSFGKDPGFARGGVEGVYHQN